MPFFVNLIREYNLYRLVADRLSADVVNPDLVIYIQSSPKRLMWNIRIRDRIYEREMNEEYINELCILYNQFFRMWNRSPILIVKGTEIDFVNNSDHRERLLRKVQNMKADKVVFSLETIND